MTIFRFRDFELNTSSHTVSGPDGAVKMRQKVFQLLTIFLYNPNRVLTKERLFEELWPDTHVEPNALSQTVLELRKALAIVDDAFQFVETVPKKGYRWAFLDIECVETLGEGFSPPPHQDSVFRNGADPTEHVPVENSGESREITSVSPTVGRTLWHQLNARKSVIFRSILSIAMVVVVVMITIWIRRPKMPQRNPLRVMVAPFVNQTGLADRDWVKVGLPKIIGTDLNRYPLLSVIPLEPHLRVFQGKGIGSSSRFEKARLATLDQQVSFDVLIGGCVTLEGERFVLEFTLHTPEGAFNTTELELANPGTVTKMISKTLGGKLGVTLVVMEDIFSSDPLVNELFGRGCQHIAFGEPAQAKPYFEICVNRDPGFLMATHGLAECHDRMGQSQKAKELCEEIFDRCDPNCSPVLTAGTHSLMGISQFHLSNFQDARKHFQEALLIYRETNRPLDMAGTLNWLGGLKAFERAFEDAQKLYEEAWDIYERENYGLGLASVLSGKGDVLSRQGDRHGAAEMWQQSMEYFGASGDRENQAALLLRMADYHLQEGVLDKVEGELVKARQIFEELKVQKRLALTYNRLADLSNARGRLNEALAHGRNGLAIFQAIGDTLNASISCHHLACTAMVMKNWSLAREYFGQSQTESEKLQGLYRREGVIFAQLGLMEIALHQGDHVSAQRHLDHVLDFKEEDPFLKSTIMCFQAVLEYKNGDFAQAHRICKQAKSLAGAFWNEGQEAYLTLYERSVSRGSSEEPLPMDLNPLHGPAGS